MSLLGVHYWHMKTSGGGDLYLTDFAVPFWEHLQPENWYAREWFEAKRQRLEGTIQFTAFRRVSWITFL